MTTVPATMSPIRLPCLFIRLATIPGLAAKNGEKSTNNHIRLRTSACRNRIELPSSRTTLSPSIILPIVRPRVSVSITTR